MEIYNKISNKKKSFLLILIAIVAFTSACSIHNFAQNTSETPVEETYNPNILNATLYYLQDNSSAFIGAKLVVGLEDGSTDVAIYNFSKPEDIGRGENVMIINGILDRAYNPESLDCFFALHNIFLDEISKDEAIKINNPYSWIWINNKFYQYLTPRPNNVLQENCSLGNLKHYSSGDYISPTRVFPRKITIKLIGNINEPFFSIKEMQPTIFFIPNGNPVPNKLKMEFDNADGHHIVVIPIKNGSFMFSEKILLIGKYSYFSPFDSFYAEIYNITPAILNKKEIKIEDNVLKLKGKAFFEKDKVTFYFNRTYRDIFITILSEIMLIYFLIKLKKIVKYTSFKTFRKISSKKLFLDYFIPLIAFVVTIFSYKFLLNIFTIISAYFLLQVFYVAFKRLSRKSFYLN